jgi:hypothetical protein
LNLGALFISSSLLTKAYVAGILNGLSSNSDIFLE